MDKNRQSFKNWNNIKGEWKTINGARVFVKDGQSIEDALKELEPKQAPQDEPEQYFKKELTKEPSNNTIRKQRIKLAALKNKAEGTYNLETGEPISYDSGYQVSFQQTSDTYTDEEYDAKVAEMIDRTGSIAHGGVFGEPEMSFHTDSIDEAMAIAKDYNQHSIFDWGNGELILNPHYIEHKNKIKR